MQKEKGTALLSVLMMLSLLLPLAAHVVLQAQLDLLMARNFQDHTDAFYLAEAGLEQALATLGTTATMARLLQGPDGVANTKDDGELGLAPALSGLDDKRGYAVRVMPSAAGRFEIVSSGRGRQGAQRAVAAVIELGEAPYTPAAFYFGGEAAQLVFDAAHLQVWSPATTDSAVDRPPPALAVTRTDIAEPAQRQHPGLPITTAAPRDASALRSAIDALLQQTAARHLPAGPGPTQLGTAAAPQLTIADGDLTISTATAGSGILLVRGALSITTSLRFDGLLIVLGDCALNPAAELNLSGALWQPSPHAVAQLNGRGVIEYNRDGLAQADAAAPGILPHALRVLGRREVT